MLHFGMNLPFYLMALYGSIMILMVLILRALLKNRLPKFVFPILWSFVMLRFLVPFSISIPLSIPVPVNPYGTNIAEAVTSLIVVEQDPMASEANVLPGLMQISSDAVSTTETTMAYGSSASAAFMPFDGKKVLPVIYVLGVLAADGRGEITSITVWRQGDPEFDERTGKIEGYRLCSYGKEMTQMF